MEFLPGPRLVDSPNKTLGAEAFDNYVKSSWQPAPANFSDGGAPANPFLSRQDTGCSQTTADSAIQSPESRTVKINDAFQGVNLKSSKLLFSPTKDSTRQSKPVGKSDVVVRPKRKPKTKASGITLEDLIRLFDKPRVIAAAELNICKSTFRNKCKQLGVYKWPYKKRSRGYCKVGEYKKVTFEETEAFDLTSLSALADNVMEDPSSLTSEYESGAENDQSPKEVFESTFLAGETTMEEFLRDLFAKDEQIGEAIYQGWDFIDVTPFCSIVYHDD